MAIPNIPAYELPAEVPPSRVHWTPDPARAVLLVHDMQRYFVAPYAGAPIPQVTAHIAELIAQSREAGVPVVYTAQPGRQDPADRGLLTDFWGDGIGEAIDADPAAADVVDELKPAAEDTVLTKWRYSAFQRSPLSDLLADWGRDQLLITGIYAHIGLQTTAVEAFMRDVQSFMIADAVADFSRDRHEQACAYVAQRCGVVTTTADTVAALSAPIPQGAVR